MGHQLRTLPATNKIGRIVTRVCKHDLARRQVEDSNKKGDEHARVVLHGQLTIHPRYDGRRGLRTHGVHLDQGLGCRHEQPGRGALVRHVTDEKAQPILVRIEEIEEIASDFQRWFQDGRDRAFLVARGKINRHHVPLDLTSHLKLTLHPILLRLDQVVSVLQFLRLSRQRAISLRFEPCYGPPALRRSRACARFPCAC